LFQLYSTSAFPTAKIKNAFEMHFGPHLKRISNASPERLLKAFLTAFEMRLRCDCGNAFYK